MGFWKDVKDLSRAISANQKAGHGRRSLIIAAQDRAIGKDKVTSVPTSDVDDILKGVGVELPSSSDLPARMTAAQYRELAEKGLLPGRKK